MAASSSTPTIALGSGPGEVRLDGAWTLRHADGLQNTMDDFPWPAGEVTIVAAGMVSLDTAGAWLLARAVGRLEQQGRSVALREMKPEFAALLALIRSRGPEVATARPQAEGWLTRLGRGFAEHWTQFTGMLAFVGEAAWVAAKVLRQPSRLRVRPILHNIQGTGFDALPIIGLLSFLMGMVVSYQGAGQLARYGANIFVADLVGLSMLRELGPLLTAIIVAGRSGSAFTAQIGTMKVTEEIDAMRTIGIPPMELLVLPKFFALVLAMPLLTVYADFAGVAGGMLMAKTQLGVGFQDFLDRFDDAIGVSAYLVGVGKSVVFAAVIVMVGCFQGFRVSGSADSVGQQTTVSVVQAIFLVIVLDAIFSIIFSWLKI